MELLVLIFPRVCDMSGTGDEILLSHSSFYSLIMERLQTQDSSHSLK